MIKLAILNQKGGVGKSSISVNLNYSLAAAGKKALLIDLDPQGNSSGIYCADIARQESISQLFRDKKFDITRIIRPAVVQDDSNTVIDDLWVIPSNIHLAVTSEAVISWPHREKVLHNHLKRITNQFDYALIDCPPSLGILSLNAIFTADYFIVPVNYDKYSLDGLADLFDILIEVKETEDYKYKIIRSMKDSRSKRTNSVVEQALDDFKSNMFKTSIRRAEVLNQALMELLPVQLFNPAAPVCEDCECSPPFA
jgi:chromosome partitioning protein